MLERLNVFLGGCGGKSAQDGDWIEALNQDRDALEKECALAVIIGMLIIIIIMQAIILCGVWIIGHVVHALLPRHASRYSVYVTL